MDQPEIPEELEKQVLPDQKVLLDEQAEMDLLENEEQLVHQEHLDHEDDKERLEQLAKKEESELSETPEPRELRVTVVLMD